MEAVTDDLPPVKECGQAQGSGSLCGKGTARIGNAAEVVPANTASYACAPGKGSAPVWAGDIFQ